MIVRHAKSGREVGRVRKAATLFYATCEGRMIPFSCAVPTSPDRYYRESPVEAARELMAHDLERVAEEPEDESRELEGRLRDVFVRMGLSPEVAEQEELAWGRAFLALLSEDEDYSEPER